jgi:hypothetical protein
MWWKLGTCLNGASTPPFPWRVAHCPSDGAVPERVGEYRSISGLRIDTSKIENARVFRPMG